jgi:Zn-dependent oligopeptidase
MQNWVAGLYNARPCSAMHPDCNNLAIATEMPKLRNVQAELHALKSSVEYHCVDCMAKMPENVMDLLENDWARA